MTLLEELEQVITELEKKKKKSYYRPKKSTIENIQTRVIHHFAHDVREVLEDVRKSHRIMVRELFHKMTHISFEKIRGMEKATKEQILEALVERVNNLELTDEEFLQYFGQNSYRTSQRIRLLVKGEELSEKREVTPKEEQKLLAIYKKVVELCFREVLLDEKVRLAIVKEITAFYEYHKQEVTANDNFFNEFSLQQFASHEKKEVITYVKKWYKQTNQPLGTKALSNPMVTYFYISNYVYLFSKEEKKKWQEKFRLLFQKQFQQYMSMKKKDLDSLKSLKERVEKVEGWI